MEFEWDEAKNEVNKRKHGISFEGAVRVFENHVRRQVDSRKNYGEQRLVVLGIADGIILYVVFTMRGTICRIISARRANKRERKKY